MAALVRRNVCVAALVRVLAMVLAVVQDTDGVFKSLSKDQICGSDGLYICVPDSGSVSQQNEIFHFVSLSLY